MSFIVTAVRCTPLEHTYFPTAVFAILHTSLALDVHLLLLLLQI